MRPSAALQGRIKNRVRFTTKNVGKGFYRGTGTGALGAHTRFGNYLIDWRKVRHYVVPDLQNTTLTPFVSGSIYKDAELPTDVDGNMYDPKNIDGVSYLRWWRNWNMREAQYLELQESVPEETAPEETTPEQTIPEEKPHKSLEGQ